MQLSCMCMHTSSMRMHEEACVCIHAQSLNPETLRTKIERKFKTINLTTYHVLNYKTKKTKLSRHIIT